MNYLEELEIAYKKERKHWKEDHRIRVHRALSWLKAAEKYSKDPDISFMAAINANNACWGTPMVNDMDAIDKMVKNLVGTSSLSKIKSIMRGKEGSEWVASMIQNKHLYWQYWKFVQGEMPEAEYQAKSASLKHHALKAMKTQKYEYLLKTMLKQCVVLRGQVLHGFTTYESKANRDTIRSSAKFLTKITTCIAQELVKSPNKDWGEVPWVFNK